MGEHELNDETTASQLRHEDTEELALNLAMYAPVKPEKDPLDSSTTAEFALESTPVFDQLVKDLGYDPLKGQYSPETQRLQLKYTESLIVEAEMLQEQRRRLGQQRRQPKRGTRRDRRN